MGLASRLQIPLITLVDTPGPSYDRASEERGQGGAIASTMALMAQLSTPTVSVVIGEAGSEGALALGVADRNLMLENATYSAVSQESAGSRTPEVEVSVALTAQECLELGIIDAVVPEPAGGANRNPDEAARLLKEALEEEITALSGRSSKRILRDRYRKFRNMGEFSSHVRAAVGREVAYLQGYVTQGVRLIRRRRRRREALPPAEQDKGE
jgi:acetyl-CoA carboxylase alpha subunit